MNISVNLSSKQFNNLELPKLIDAQLKKNSCEAHHLKVEITETLLLQENSLVLELLISLSNMGVKVALDDFGTGYSSLSYLKKFPIDIIKIDQSFIRDIALDSEDAVLVKTIIAMSKGLKMDIVAEGVETIEQKNFLEIEGCHLIQGYYYSKPINADEVENFILDF